MMKKEVIQREHGWLELEVVKAKKDIASWPVWIRNGTCLAGGSISEPRGRVGNRGGKKGMMAKRLKSA